MLTLPDIAPSIAAEVDYMNYVVIFGPEICGYCENTMKQLKAGGIQSIKIVVEDNKHPVVVALKVHLGVDPDAPIQMPAVFVNGEFRWNDMNRFEIMRLIKSRELVASRT